MTIASVSAQSIDNYSAWNPEWKSEYDEFQKAYF